MTKIPIRANRDFLREGVEPLPYGFFPTLIDIVGEGLCALPKNILTPIGLEIKNAIQFVNDNYIGYTDITLDVSGEEPTTATIIEKSMIPP